MPVAQEELVLDRPFLFVIHDTAHGTPLFVGRVADPS
jgi:serpin B